MANNIAPPADLQRCIAILGMHRSGTSALAGSLRQAGVHLGRVLDQGFDRNPKGLQEPAAVLFMHENLLEANGGSWHTPPEEIAWQRLHQAVRDLFIESRQGQPLWGFKDPRTLLVLSGWLDALPRMECVGIFRHPVEVASSMHSRNQFPLEKCFKLWVHYNQRLLVWHRRLGFPLIEFVADPGAMAGSIDRVLAHLRLSPIEPLDFYDHELRRFDAGSGPPMPEDAANLYRQLQACAATDA
jgi:hypothetical protein